MPPLISIIIPLYNRAELIERTLSSCVRQSFRSWEAIVVDDASSDGSPEVVVRFPDARVKLVRHESNRGPCAARNTGVARACAAWLLFLDSDDELVDGALDLIWRRCAAAPGDVAKLFFACRWDNGVISPDPPFDGVRMDYEGFVRWLGRMTGRPTETIAAVRRDAFLKAPYPERKTWEGSHNLDFARRFSAIGYADVVRLYHLDAANRRMAMVRDPRGIIEEAPGLAWMADTVLQDHGEALRRWAPAVFQGYLRSGSLHHLLSGNRARGVALAWRAWRNQPSSLKSLAVLAAAWMPIWALAMLKTRFTA